MDVPAAPARLKRRLAPIYQTVRRRTKRLNAQVQYMWYRVYNRTAHRPVTGSASLMVSLTSYGQRVEQAFATIEAIGAGSIRPRRLVLWLDDPAIAGALPPELVRLQARGLEVRLTTNLGPHTKYFPSLAELDGTGLSLVTADDDILYPRRWLADLLEASTEHPGHVCCHRAYVVSVRGEAIAPYSTWPVCRTTDPGPTIFATGVSGVLYPPRMLAALRERGTAFLESTPKADDVWLHWVAWRAGVPVRQVRATARHFPIVPGTQEVGLIHANVGEGANDRWISQVYDDADAKGLAAAGAPAR
ncbi:hypothetical protein [Micropruina sp.]|uniref:hypothetical protein n=1 Tax=Micropruina sp. TaxID=2737536 RepID=UPI0039E6727F